jgi:primosomal protein N' (replication factor Y)
LPPLTAEQKQALDQLGQGSAATALIHGDTGTGKTRIYLERAKYYLSQGRSVLILTPEIGLTPQLIQFFEAQLPNQVVTVHSHLTAAERRNVWRQIFDSKQPLVVIGPRSALFSPFASLGCIIIDEAHDAAYKQEQAPYYLASRVAATLATLHHAQLILGSATPLVTDYYVMAAKHRPIIRLTKSAVNESSERTITTIDLRNQQLFSRSAWLSDALLTAIEQNVGRHEQSLIFLNRRGTARLVVCGNCSWQALCPRCELPLTYHGDSHLLICHTCGYKSSAPASCPVCQSTDILFKSIGTKSLVAELHRLLPKARIARFDSDNSKEQRLEQQYAAIHQGDVDILVGTQLLTKGLDLPLLSLVGVVLADTALYFPDFTAEERTYQVLNQVFGRVGRGHRAGQVIVQSYHPDSPTIQAAIDNDYDRFYQTQIAERKLFHYPPSRYLLKLQVRRKTKKAAESNAVKLISQLQQLEQPIEIIGPSPAFQEKAQDYYRWQVIVKSTNRQLLSHIVQSLPPTWTHDLDPTHLL